MKGYIKRGLLALAAVLALVLWRDHTQSSYRLEGVSNAIDCGDGLCLIDNNGDTYNLFLTDYDGTINGRIDLPKLVDGWWNAYSSLTADTDGQIYVYCYSRAMDWNETRSAVLRCDFDRGRLEPVWELPTVKMLQVRVNDGTVSYTAPAAGDTTGFYEMDQKGNTVLRARIDATFYSVKQAYYSQIYGPVWADWNGRFFRDGRELGDGGPRDYANIHVDEEGIFYTDLSDGWVKTVGWDQTQPEPLFEADKAALLDSSLSYPDVLPFHYGEDGSWIAGVDIGGARRVFGMFDAQGRQQLQLQQVKLSGWDRLEHAARAACFGIAALAAAYGAGWLVLRKTGGTVPIIIQLLGLLIPVFIIACMFFNKRLEQSLSDRLERMEYDLLYVIADQKLSAIDPGDLMAMDLDKVPDDPLYRKVFQSTDFSTLTAEFYELGNTERQPVIASVYQWIFMYRDGALRYLEVSGNHYFGARVAYDRNRLELDKMREAMETQHIVKTEYNDFTGDFIALYVPVIDQQGRSVGVMESGLNRRILTYEVYRQMGQVYRLLGGLLALLVTVLTSVLTFSLYPLTRVKAAVDDLSRGDLGRQVAVRGRDEVTAIGAAFNHMSGRLKEQMEFIQACMDGYAAFVPRRVLEILKRDDITQVSLGDQNEIQASVLDVNSTAFQELSRSMDGEALYGMINQMLKEMLPAVAEDRGVVDHMKEDGLTAYYPLDGEGALRSAVSICERINSLRSQGLPVPLYRASVNYGIIRLGIVGDQGRMAASTISEIVAMSGFLMEAGERYGARILVTESAAGQIRDFDGRYHVRMIGYILRRKTGKMEALYDVYDGDEQEERRAKAETAAQFKKGTDAYQARDYYEARQVFAGILRRNGRDLAARTYVYRCDQYCQFRDEKSVPPYLAEY